MAGHNKWSKIKRKKGATDAARSKVFSRIIKEITVAIKEGSSADPAFNPRLRTALLNAKGNNMPKDTIERAIKKASESSDASYLEPTYEGYAPGGVALFVECTTDNLNRTVAAVRAAFSKHGGSLATNGSVDFLFDRKAIFIIERGSLDIDEVTLELIDGGADDVEADGEELTITAAMEDFGSVQAKLDELSIEPKSAELQRIAITPVDTDAETAKKALKLIDVLEEHDDVNTVFHNMELTEEILEVLEA